MIKVCGVTFDHTTNYGSCFQAFALQNTIDNMIVSGEKCSYKLIPLKTLQDYPQKQLSFAGEIYDKTYQYFHRKQFLKFEEKYLHFVQCNSIKDLGLLNKDFDAFVCGSDVIWSPEFNQGLGAYYLDFAQKYSFSYAPSFGKADENNLNPDIIKWIKNIDKISCRENNGIKIIEKITGIKPQVVVDPVYLLDEKQWMVFMDGGQNTSKKYILSYNVYNSPVYEDFLQKLKNETGLPIIRTTWKLKNSLKQGILKVHDPQEWLKLISQAEYVVTNSFHGTAFSTIFHRKFFTILRGEVSKGFNIRLYDHLNNLGLKDRIFTSVPSDINMNDVDYVKADEIIKHMRESSMDYLQGNLEEAYQQKLQQKGE